MSLSIYENVLGMRHQGNGDGLTWNPFPYITCSVPEKNICIEAQDVYVTHFHWLIKRKTGNSDTKTHHLLVGVHSNKYAALFVDNIRITRQHCLVGYDGRLMTKASVKTEHLKIGSLCSGLSNAWHGYLLVKLVSV